MTTSSSPARIVIGSDRGRTRVRHLAAGDHLIPRLLGVDGAHVRVALVGACALLLAGDEVRLEIVVEPGVRLELVEPSGMVAYDMRGGAATWSVAIDVAEEAGFVWRAAPFVAAHGSRVTRRTDIELAEGATALLGELLVLGRSGEPGGALRSFLRASHAGHPLLVEDLDLTDPAWARSAGAMGAHRVLGSTTLLGLRPETTPDETPLAGPGARAWALGLQAHQVEDTLAATWDRWLPLVTSAGAPGRRAA